MLLGAQSYRDPNPPEKFWRQDLADISWLYARARQSVEAVRREAGGLVYYTPGGCYGGLFTRDFCYVVEGTPELVGAETLKQAIKLILRHQRPDGGGPTMVNPENDQASYCTIGDATRFTDTDNSSMLVKLMQHYLVLNGDKAFAAEVLLNVPFTKPIVP